MAQESILVAQESILVAHELILVAQESILGLVRSGLVQSGPFVDIRPVVEVWSGLVVEFSGLVRSDCWNYCLWSCSDFHVPVLKIRLFPVWSGCRTSLQLQGGRLAPVAEMRS